MTKVTSPRRAAALLLAALLTACGGDAAPNPNPDPDPEPGAFAPDTPVDGPRLWLEADLQDGRALVTLFGAELGDVFGWSTHLRYDPAALTVESGDITPDALGDATEITPLAVSKPADLVLAATRHEPALGGASLDAPTALATAVLAIAEPASSRLDLTPVVVRRADGSYVALTALGGTLNTAGDTTGGAP